MRKQMVTTMYNKKINPLPSILDVAHIGFKKVMIVEYLGKS